MRAAPDGAQAGRAGLRRAARADRARTCRASRSTSIVAPALGGVVLGYELARQCGTTALFAERVEGRFALRRGFALAPGARVLIAEDVVTTGLSTRECMACVARRGRRGRRGRLPDRPQRRGASSWACRWSRWPGSSCRSIPPIACRPSSPRCPRPSPAAARRRRPRPGGARESCGQRQRARYNRLR